MYCDKCGAWNTDNSKYCIECGARLAGDESFTNEHISEDEFTGTSCFDGTGGQLFVNRLLLIIVSIFTLGIATPWFLVRIINWKTEHMVINGKRLQFNGTGGQLWGLWIKWWFLSIITCGIYSFFARVDFYKWQARHTSFEGKRAFDGIYQGSQFTGNSFELLGYSILSGLLIAVTCGIALPWCICILDNWYFKSLLISHKKLVYEGTGGKLFWKYLLWSLLNLLTCGLYSSWAICNMNQFIMENLHINKRYLG